MGLIKLICVLYEDSSQVDLCFICSSNKTLQALDLRGNEIDDDGAASIGGALAYVTL